VPVGYSIYVEKESPIHHDIDPRTKLAVLGTLFVLSLCYNHPAFLAVLVLFVAVVTVWAKLGLKSLVAPLIAASWFLILSLVIWPFYIEQGQPLFEILNTPITDDGILFAIAMGLRVSNMVIAATVWMMVTSPQMMTLGLLEMGLPYKAGIAMSSAIRFVPLINAERATIIEAQRARGLDYEKGGVITRIFRAVPIIGPLFLRSIDLAQSLAVAMDARGFAARDGRSSLYSIAFTSLDKAIMITCAVLVVLSIVARFLGIGVLIPGHL
jgi:energy-coupling factor transport system permease protein